MVRKGPHLLQLIFFSRRWCLVVERRSQSSGSYCHGKSSQGDWILRWKFDEWQDLLPESSIGEDANGKRMDGCREHLAFASKLYTDIFVCAMPLRVHAGTSDKFTHYVMILCEVICS